MNKLFAIAIATAGLTLINAPEAAAHDEVRVTRVTPAGHIEYRQRNHSREYYKRNVRDRDFYRHYRSEKMPRWLKRKKSFRRWYRDTPLRRYRNIGWNQLFDIYRWERSYFQYRRH